MAKIHAPNKEYTGVSASVPFVNGVGESDNSVLLSWFEAHGYKVEKSEEKPLAKMNKAELLAVAAEKGISVPDGTTNSEIVKLIEAARAQ